MPIFTIYVGMALSDAPEEFRTDFQNKLKGELRSLSQAEILDGLQIEVLDFFWTTKGPDAGEDTEVYELDEQHAQSADLFVAVLDYTSTGLGMEIMIRHATGKPSLFFAREGKKISRMPKGYLQKFSKPLHRYGSVTSIVEIIMAHILSEQSNYWP